MILFAAKISFCQVSLPGSQSHVKLWEDQGLVQGQDRGQGLVAVEEDVVAVSVGVEVEVHPQNHTGA